MRTGAPLKMMKMDIMIRPYLRFASYRPMLLCTRQRFWKELGNGMPRNESFGILRWPRRNGVRTGLDLADPQGRREILSALVKLREFFLLDEWCCSMYKICWYF